MAVIAQSFTLFESLRQHYECGRDETKARKTFSKCAAADQALTILGRYFGNENVCTSTNSFWIYISRDESSPKKQFLAVNLKVVGNS